MDPPSPELLVVSGCLYAMRRELAVRLPEDTLGDDIYLPQAAELSKP